MIELQLRVETDGGAIRDVSAVLTEQHRVAELATAIARHIGLQLPPGHVPKLVSNRLGHELEPHGLVVENGLLAGDLVHLRLTAGVAQVPALGDRGGLFCDVVSGASSGHSLPLEAGRTSIGRDESCDLVIADPTVSKVHAELFVDSSGAVEVAPSAEITNAVVLDGHPLAERTPLPLGAVIELGSSALVVRHYEPETGAGRDQLGQIPFNRTPYRHPDLSPVEVRGPGRPPAPHEPRPLMVLAMVAPVIAGVAFAVILGRALFLLFALMAPISMLGSWISERRRGGATHKQQVETFERRFVDWEQRYDEELAEERRRRYRAAPDVVDLARRAELRTPDLWARSARSEGFLELRLGLGDIPAATTTRAPDGVDEDPDQRIEHAIDKRRLLPSAPVTVDLTERGVLALHGDPREVETSASSIIIQAATLHSPDDLVICGYLDPRRTLNDWLKWLPHTRSVVSPLAGDHLAVGREGAEDLLRRLVEVIAAREKGAWPVVLVVLDELAVADNLLVSTVLEAGPEVGVHAVWIGASVHLVPRQATAIVDCPPLSVGRRATLWTTTPTEPERQLTLDRLSLEAAPRLARSLAPVRDASSASAASSIPRLAPLLSTLGVPTLDADEVAARWARHPHDYGLAAPIGIGPTGPLQIDLVEHGPHGLIAGTSGAGKSELLQSMIAALVANHPPARLNLLFIDYKGGASSNVFQNVPHTVGYVTNLEADLAMRALVSLRAELDRRMRVMEGRAKDLEEMLREYPDEAPPSLVIVVDEFATLVKEIPDFVAGMVDIAQRGRSLGIHLILATQRPAGAVNDNILANTNLRISLRVLDPSDSSSILGSAEAAEIPAPLRGRGFARLGAGSLVEFQSAYSGAPYTVSGGVAPVVVASFPDDGRVTVHPPPPEVDDATETTHLEVVLDAVVGAADAQRLGRGRRPWLEDLPDLVELADVLDGAYGPMPGRVAGRDVVVGVVDLPEQQAQRPEVVDLEDAGGLLVFGTGGSGKTTTLRTLVASAIVEATPAEVEVHVLDFSGRALDGLRDLPHVAAVAAADDLEQVTRVLMHLREEVSRRQAALAEARAEDLSAYNRRHSGATLGRLLLVVDGYEAFARTFERGELYPWADLFLETVLAGRAAGLHLIATADRRVSVPAALSNAVTGRLVLRTADVDGLIDLGIPPAVARTARLGDGRALRADGAPLQIAVVGDDVSGFGQTAALDAWSTRAAGPQRARLPALPHDLRVDELPPVTGDGPMSFPLGVADLTLEPVVCDVRLQHLAVIGPDESGRSTALRTAAAGLRANGVDVWVVADPESPLAFGNWPHLATRRDEHRPLIDELTTVAADGQRRPVLVVDAVERLADDAGMPLESLLRDDAVRVLAAADAGTLGGFVSGWPNALKAVRRKLLLQPDGLDLPSLTTARIRLRPNQAFPPGRGVFVSGKDWRLVQVARSP